MCKKVRACVLTIISFVVVRMYKFSCVYLGLFFLLHTYTWNNQFYRFLTAHKIQLSKDYPE